MKLGRRFKGGVGAAASLRHSQRWVDLARLFIYGACPRSSIAHVHLSPPPDRLIGLPILAILPILRALLLGAVIQPSLLQHRSRIPLILVQRLLERFSTFENKLLEDIVDAC